MLSNCHDLDDYFREFGALLGDKANKALSPLHNPAHDPIHPGIASLLRPPLPVQADAITAIPKAWRRQKSVILAAQPGTGKSLMGCAASHLHAAGRPYRALVMCPDHLIGKWEEEILTTLPDVSVHAFSGWRDVLQITREDLRGDRPRWYLLGRDQSKFDPGKRFASELRRSLVMEPQDLRRIRGDRPIGDFVGDTVQCPKCGRIVADRQGNPLSRGTLAEKKRWLTCDGEVTRWVTVGEQVKEITSPCDEPLWQFTGKPWRWAPYRIIHRSHWKIDYLILDEAHELDGGDEVAQANAAGTLIACSKKVLALTGTLIGGFAEHLFPLLMRLDARSLRRDGFVWNGYRAFNERYGRIETTIYSRTRMPEEGRNNLYTRGSTTSRKIERCRPGIMPQLYGDHLADKVIFLTLEQVAPNLPGLSEEIIPVAMDPEQAEAYNHAQDWFRSTVKQMLAMGNKRLLGRMLATLLAYPDYPFGWEAISNGMGGAMQDEFTPVNLPEEVVRPKEAALIALVERERSLGRQTWVYTTMTQVRDCSARLVQILGNAGIRAIQLRETVNRRERLKWIYKHARDADCIISHPKLVETGMDFFAKDGNHNFPTLAFYQTGYQLATMRQAACRSYRIGQWLPCRTCYLYYLGTMQEKAMAHMGRKLSAAEAIEGKFSTEGIVALAEDDDATMALARALVDRIDNGIEVSWAGSLGYQKPEPPTLKLVDAPPPRRLSLTAEEVALFNQLYAKLCGA